MGDERERGMERRGERYRGRDGESGEERRGEKGRGGEEWRGEGGEGERERKEERKKREGRKKAGKEGEKLWEEKKMLVSLLVVRLGSAVWMWGLRTER